MGNQKRKNGEDNIINAKKCQLVDLNTSTSFCDWNENSEEQSDTEFNEGKSIL